MQVMPFLNSIFFPKKTGRHVVEVKRYFSCQKVERKYLFQKKYVCRFQTQFFRELPNTLLVELVRLHEKAFPQIEASEFSVASYTIKVYP